MRTIRSIITVSGLLFIALLMLAPPAAADNCDIFTNPQDCQNTAWTIGVIATLAGGVAVATVATAASRRQREPLFPLILPGSRTTQVDVRPIPDAPSVTIQPPDGVVSSHSVTLRVQSDSGWQMVQEVGSGTN